MNLIELPAPPVKPAAQQIAEHMLSSLNANLAERIHCHCAFFSEFWDSTETPDAILATMGSNAPLMLRVASESLNHIERIAGMVGKTLDDFIVPELYEPRRGFVATETGIALAPPADGFDAWGRLIPTQEPE